MRVVGALSVAHEPAVLDEVHVALNARSGGTIAHDLFLAMVPPERALESHVNLIQHGRLACHAQRPDHAHCPLAPRCRFVDPHAPDSPGSRGSSGRRYHALVIQESP